MRIKQIFAVLLLIAALIPYFIICFYALPFADDFCYGWTAAENIPFIQKFLKQYYGWNGRYTSDVLVQFHPLRYTALYAYQWVLFITMLITPAIVLLFIKNFTEGWLNALIASLAITLFYFTYMPNITEGLYWYIGIVNYHIGNLILLLQVSTLIYMLRQGSTSQGMLTVSCLLLITCAGFNEVAALAIPPCYLTAYIITRKNHPVARLLLMHFAIAFIASLFVILAPGNFVRTAQFEKHFDIIHSLIYALLQTIRFVGTWFLNYAFIALSILVLLTGPKIKTGLVSSINHRLILPPALFIVFMGSFVPYFATGMLGQHRTINLVMLLLLLLWFIFLLSVSHRLPFMFISRKNFTGVATAVLFSSAIIVMALTGNTWRVYQDYKYDLFDEYTSTFTARQNEFAKTGVLYPLKNIPSTFTIVDARGDTAWWVDKCMRNYYRDAFMK